MTDHTSKEHEAQNINLKTYNNIVKQSICIDKKTILKKYLRKRKMTINEHGKL